MEGVSAIWKDSKMPLIQQQCSRFGRSWSPCSMATGTSGCHFQGMYRSISRSRTVGEHFQIWCSSSHENSDESRQSSSTRRALIESDLKRIQGAGVIACLRTDSPELALESARAALNNNITVLEVTMTTPAATEVIEILVREYPTALIGAGTVLSWKDAERALCAGAKFLFSPVALKDVVARSRDDSVLFIPGAMTPTEVANAYDWGAQAVKLFPVGLAGGPRLVNALKRTLPHIPLIVSSQVTLDMLESYLNAGAISAVLSDPIFDKTAMTNRNFTIIEERARAVAAKAAFVVRQRLL